MMYQGINGNFYMELVATSLANTARKIRISDSPF